MNGLRHDRFHGRVSDAGRACGAPGCSEPGEFRAPGERLAGADGPGEWRWFCLDHVRAFNAGYNFFAGMTAEQIWAAQSPIAGWANGSRAFSPGGGADAPPRWADFTDPLDAIAARLRRTRAGMGARQDGRSLNPDERRALETMGLDIDADRRALRTSYAQLVRKLHPDHNGGDRSHEARLQRVIEAYQLLRKATVFA